MLEAEYLPWPSDPKNYITVVPYKDKKCVLPHKHDFVEIVFFAYGSCLHKYMNVAVTLIPGDIFVIMPHEEHSYEISSDTVIYNCLFYPEALGADWKYVKEIGGIFDFLMVEPFYRSEVHCQEVIHMNPAEASVVEGIFKRMIEEQQSDKIGSYLAQKANLLMLLVYMGRLWDKQFNSMDSSFNAKREMLIKALDYIEQHISDELKVDELASKVYLSSHYFRKIFKEVIGLSPLEYINKMRIAKAQQLLLTSTEPISSVSEKVGINDVNYFSRLFKIITGLTPSEYRKTNNLY